jgi:bacterioferritin
MADIQTFPGNPKVVSDLQSALASEAHLNLQYRMYQRLLKFMGAKKLAPKMHKFGDDTHDWLKAVTDQVLFLGGKPAYTILPVAPADTLTDILANALTAEMATVQPYEQAIETARLAFDDATRNLYEHLRKWHNGHIGWLMTQLNLIKGIGEEEYLAEKL